MRGARCVCCTLKFPERGREETGLHPLPFLTRKTVLRFFQWGTPSWMRWRPPFASCWRAAACRSSRGALPMLTWRTRRCRSWVPSRTTWRASWSPTTRTKVRLQAQFPGYHIPAFKVFFSVVGSMLTVLYFISVFFIFSVVFVFISLPLPFPFPLKNIYICIFTPASRRVGAHRGQRRLVVSLVIHNDSVVAVPCVHLFPPSPPGIVCSHETLVRLRSSAMSLYLYPPAGWYEHGVPRLGS